MVSQAWWFHGFKLKGATTPQAVVMKASSMVKRVVVLEEFYNVAGQGK